MTYDRQVQREIDMRDRGEHRAKKALSRALERGAAAETPAGIVLAKRAIQPLSDAIRAFLAPRKGAGRRHTAASLLKGVDPDLAAYITVRTAIGWAAQRRTLKTTALYVAEMLETELVAERFENANGALYRAIIRNAEARGLSAERQAKSVMLANKHFGVTERPWTPAQRLHLGLKLVELAIETLGIFVAVQERTSRKKNTHHMAFTAEIGGWMAKYNDAVALTKPFLLPTLVPPKPWTEPTGTSYYSTAVRGGNLVSKSFKGHLEKLKEATEAGTMAPVYTGLNAIQQTPWRINKRVLAVMQAAWEGNLAGLPLPTRESELKPEAPPEVVNDVKGGEHRREWRRKMRDWHKKDQAEKSQRFELQRALSIAEENADEPAIYFPHRLDFRDRAYAAGTTFR